MGNAKTWLALAVSALLPACLQETEGAPQEPQVSNVAAAASGVPSTTGTRAPLLVASWKVASGNTIEIYNFDGQAMISEVGVAGTPSTLNANLDIKHGRPIDIWNALGPKASVPPALATFQAQLDSSPLTPGSGTQQKPSTVVGGVELEAPSPTTSFQGVIANTPNGCNNGCCDYTWLSTFEQCKLWGQDYEWFLYNYGATWVNSNNIDIYDGFACSAVGTSTYSVNMGGFGGTWSVPEATYRTWYRKNSSCWFSCDNMTSTVNTSSSQHLHTYCGWVSYF